MTTPVTDSLSCPFPPHVAVLGAAGLGQGVVSVCRAEGIVFTAIVRSRPERITDVPSGSRVTVVTSLADRGALTEAFSGASAVLTVLGLTSTSCNRSALLSASMLTVEGSMLAAGVDRIIVTNTVLALTTWEAREPGHALLFVDARFNGARSFRTTSGSRRPRRRCVFVASLDPGPSRSQLSG
ncbi:MAG: NAD(P)H-binding protein [Acidobacteriota bacterium]